MSDPIQDILVKLNSIEEKLDKVQESCNNLNERLERIEISSDTMDEHVQWINEVHNSIKTPLYTALNAVNNIMHPLTGSIVDIEEIPNAPVYPSRLTYIVDDG